MLLQDTELKQTKRERGYLSNLLLITGSLDRLILSRLFSCLLKIFLVAEDRHTLRKGLQFERTKVKAAIESKDKSIV